jgi:hypothetical protein
LIQVDPIEASIFILKAHLDAGRILNLEPDPRVAQAYQDYLQDKPFSAGSAIETLTERVKVGGGGQSLYMFFSHNDLRVRDTSSYHRDLRHSLVHLYHQYKRILTAEYTQKRNYLLASLISLGGAASLFAGGTVCTVAGTVALVAGAIFALWNYLRWDEFFIKETCYRLTGYVEPEGTRHAGLCETAKTLLIDGDWRSAPQGVRAPLYPRLPNRG